MATAAQTAHPSPAPAHAPVSKPVSRRRLFWSVCLGHMTIDGFSSIGPVLMAFIALHMLPMTNTQIGFAVSAYQLVGALSQPFFGLQADRTGGRWLGAGSVAWMGGLMVLSVILATTGSYWAMVIPFIMAALGSGAFHPVGTLHASEASRSSGARELSIFFLMGQTGSAIAPTLVGILLDRASSNNGAFTAALGPAFNGLLIEHGSVSPVLFLCLLTIPSALFMLLSMPGARAYLGARAAAGAVKADAAHSKQIVLRSLILLAVVVTLRSLANPGTVAFLPRLFQLKGWTAAEYGLITGGFWLASGLAGVAFGHLAERFGTRNVIALSLLAGAPVLFIMPSLDGVLAFVFAWGAGALTGGSHSIIVAMSQQLMPARKGLVSGSVLGFIFGTGALGTLVIGALSDRLGLITAYQIVAVSLVLTGTLALLLPNTGRRVISAPPLAVEPVMGD